MARVKIGPALPDRTVIGVEIRPSLQAVRGDVPVFHADSSKTVFGIWLGNGTPPAIGSTKPAHGSPAAIWTGALDVLDQTWVRGHLVLAAEDHPEIKLNRDCLFGSDTPNMLCLHTKQVEFIDPRRRCDAFSDKRQKVSAKFFWLSLTCYRLLT